MAYANISRYNAVRMIKSRNISSLDQVINCCKPLAYRGWDIRDIDLVLIKSQVPSNYIGTRSREILNTRNKNQIPKNTKILNLPLVSSSRYLSCVEDSPHTTNINDKSIKRPVLRLRGRDRSAGGRGSKNWSGECREVLTEYLERNFT